MIKKLFKYSLVVVAMGFLFNSCEFDDLGVANSIEGVWSVQEQHEDLGVNAYQVEILVSPEDPNEVHIYNFLHLGNGLSTNIFATALVDGNELIIPQQTIDGHTISGTGIISSGRDEIQLSHTDNYGSGNAQVDATYTSN